MSSLFLEPLTNRILSYLFPLFCAVLVPYIGWCSENELTPYIHLRQEYSDNLFMASTDAIDDFILTLSPGLALSRKSELLKLNLTGHFDHAKYFDHSELDGNDTSISGNASVSATERLTLSADAAYAKDSRPDRDLDDTGLVLDTTRRDRYQGGVSGNFVFTERTSANFSGSCQKDDYKLIQNEAYDLLAYSASAGIFHQPAYFNRRAAIFSNLQYSRYEYEKSTVDYYALTAGLENQFSETLSIHFNLGARYTRSVFQSSQLVLIPSFGYAIVPVEAESTNWGTVGQVSLSYDDEFNHCAVSASHDIEPASGRQGSAERTTIRATLRRRFSQELQCSIDGSYYFNNAEADQFSSNAINAKTFRGLFRIRYDISRLFYIENGWTYSRTDDSIANVSADRNLAFIAVNYKFEID